MPGDETWQRILGLVRSEPVRVDDPPLLVGQLRRVCRAAASTLPASGVGISVITSAGQQLVGASSERHAAIEELQFTVGEGPCLMTYATGAPVLVADVGADGLTRWPGYGSELLERGTCGVFAFPLQVGAARLGALDVYQDQPGPLPRPAIADALMFAEVALSILLDAGRIAGEATTPALDDLLDGDHPELYQAQGMVMVQLGIDAVDAMARLRSYAYAHGRSLSAVALDVVARKIVFEV